MVADQAAVAVRRCAAVEIDALSDDRLHIRTGLGDRPDVAALPDEGHELLDDGAAVESGIVDQRQLAEVGPGGGIAVLDDRLVGSGSIAEIPAVARDQPVGIGGRTCVEQPCDPGLHLQLCRDDGIRRLVERQCHVDDEAGLAGRAAPAGIVANKHMHLVLAGCAIGMPRRKARGARAVAEIPLHGDDAAVAVHGPGRVELDDLVDEGGAVAADTHGRRDIVLVCDDHVERHGGSRIFLAGIVGHGERRAIGPGRAVDMVHRDAVCA